MAPHIQGLAQFMKIFQPTWPSPKRFIGGGVNGRVFETTNGRLLKLVASFAPQEWATLLRLQGTHTVPRFKKDDHVNLQLSPRIKSNVNIAKKFSSLLNMNIGNGVTAFIMGSVGGGKAMTLEKYAEKFPKANRTRIQNRVKYLIEEMHVRGISHGNLHGGNILVTADLTGRITGMWAIDFGRSTRISRKKTERQHYGLKPTSEHFTPSLFKNKEGYVPVFNGSRMNVHMARIHYGEDFTRENENRIAKHRESIRKNLELLKSPKKVSSVRRAKSLSPVKPRVSPRKTRSVLASIKKLSPTSHPRPKRKRNSNSHL